MFSCKRNVCDVGPLTGAGPQVSPLAVPQLQHSVARSQHGRFDRWHQGWLSEHVTPAAERAVANWLMGDEEEDMVPCKTSCVTRQVNGLPVNRYQVCYSSKPPASP